MTDPIKPENIPADEAVIVRGLNLVGLSYAQYKYFAGKNGWKEFVKDDDGEQQYNTVTADEYAHDYIKKIVLREMSTPAARETIAEAIASAKVVNAERDAGFAAALIKTKDGETV